MCVSLHIVSISTISPCLLISSLREHTRPVLTQTKLEGLQEVCNYMHSKSLRCWIPVSSACVRRPHQCLSRDIKNAMCIILCFQKERS